MRLYFLRDCCANGAAPKRSGVESVWVLKCFKLSYASDILSDEDRPSPTGNEIKVAVNAVADVEIRGGIKGNLIQIA